MDQDFGPEHEQFKSLKEYSVAKLKELKTSLETVAINARKDLDRHKFEYKKTKDLAESNDYKLKDMTTFIKQSEIKIEELQRDSITPLKDTQAEL